jgi:hypothetical protein
MPFTGACLLSYHSLPYLLSVYTPQARASCCLPYGIVPPAFCFWGIFWDSVVRVALFNTPPSGFFLAVFTCVPGRGGKRGTHVFVPGDWRVCCLRPGPSFVLSPVLSVMLARWRDVGSRSVYVFLSPSLSELVGQRAGMARGWGAE